MCGFMVYDELIATLEKLDKQQCGELIAAIATKVADAKFTFEVSPLIEVMATPFVARITKDQEKYREKCERNRTNILNRWHNKNTNEYDRIQSNTNEYDRIQSNTNEYDRIQSNEVVSSGTITNNHNDNNNNNQNNNYNDNDKKEIDKEKGANAPKRNTPVRPTKEQIAEYCKERNNGIDADYFYDYYEARGWKYSNNQPMKDFKAAVRTWERNNKNKGGASAPQMRTHPNVLHQEDMVYTDF